MGRPSFTKVGSGVLVLRVSKASGIQSRAEVKELEEKMTLLQSEKMTLENAK